MKRTPQEKLERAIETGRKVTLTADEAEAVILNALVPVPVEVEVSLLPAELRSFQPQRLRKFTEANAERVYVARWLRENRRQFSWNRGFSLLEWILCPDGRDVPLPVSRRDARVATSIIQWLGTNCGRNFIAEAERKIAALEEVQSLRRTDEWKRKREAERQAQMQRDVGIVEAARERRAVRARDRAEKARRADRGLRLVGGRKGE